MKLTIKQHVPIVKIESYKPIKNKRKLWFADIETVLINNKHVPVVLCYINETKIYKHVLDPTDIDNYENLFVIFLETMMRVCENGIIFFHNLSRFDSFFILKHLLKNNSNNYEVKQRHNNIYEIKKQVGKNITYIRDSYLITSLSLAELSNQFSVTKFKNTKFNYESITETYFNKNLNKIIEQCLFDCEALQESFLKFRSILLDRFGIDAATLLSLPSIAFNLFRSKYYLNSSIDFISKNPFKEDQFIRQSYMGGLTELYIPYLENGYCYDVNSLYPTVMRNNLYPTGKPKWVKGVDININNFIGFIECRVKSPSQLEVPFLPYRHPQRGIITPLGEWTGVYFHKEIKKAIELGYTFEFIKGLKYETETFLFQRYIDDIYGLRLSSKGTPLEKICKLLLNSLYGRFGMNVLKEHTKFLNLNEIKKLKGSKEYKIENVYQIFDDNAEFYLVKYKRLGGVVSKTDYSECLKTNTAVQIASAITSYARIFMYDFKVLKDNPCYYSDTDSIFLSKPLDDFLVGSDLGKFKLEYKINKAYFVAPKVYKIIYKEDGTSKIVFKGLKEIELQFLNNIFEDLIHNVYKPITIHRENLFKRDYNTIDIVVDQHNISLMVPFYKREKVLSNNIWIGTKPFNIDIK